MATRTSETTRTRRSTTTGTRGRARTTKEDTQAKPETEGVAEVRAGEAGEGEGRVVVVRLPFLTARIETPPPPPEGGLRLGPVSLPSPQKTAYYLGLGVLAAVEVIEWPIAVAIAAGTYIAQHSRPEAAALQAPHLHLERREPGGEGAEQQHNGQRPAEAKA